MLLFCDLCMLYVPVHTGVCTCACRCLVHVCACALFLGCSPPYFVLSSSLSLKLQLIGWPMSSKDSPAWALHIGSGGVDKCSHIWLLCVCWCSKLRSSCLRDKHFTTEPSAEPLFCHHQVFLCKLKFSDDHPPTFMHTYTSSSFQLESGRMGTHRALGWYEAEMPWAMDHEGIG